MDTQLHRAANDPSSLIFFKTVSSEHIANPIWMAWENYFVFHVMTERTYGYSHFPMCCGCLFPLDALRILCPGLMGRCLSITCRVTLGQIVLSVNSQAPTQVLSKSPDDPSWNSSTCFGETVTDHTGNSSMAKRGISCALLPTPALQLRHSKAGTRLPCGDGKKNEQKFPNSFARSSLSAFHCSAPSQQNVINDLSTELPKAFPPPLGKPAGGG